MELNIMMRRQISGAAAGGDTLSRMQQGTYLGQGEELDWTVYDTIVLAAATREFRLFTIPLGQGSKTYSETNMESAGQIPQGHKMLVHAIKMIYTGSSVKATVFPNLFYGFMDNSYIQVKPSGKDSLFTIKLNELMGMNLNIALTPTAAGDNIRYAQGRPLGIYPLNNPITLASQTSFSVNLTLSVASNAALDGDRICLALSGKLSRLA
jgi:hypothetical protein